MRRQFRRLRSAIALLLGLMVPSLASAATYYVATTGSDGNSCAAATNPATPKRTVPAGVVCLASGDTLIVGAGTYTVTGAGIGMVTDPPSGSAGAYTTIKADPNGARPVFSLTYNPLGNYQMALLLQDGAANHHIEMRGFEIRDAYNAVLIQGDTTVGFTHHINFIDNIVFKTWGPCWQSHGSAAGGGFQGGDHLIQGNDFSYCGFYRPNYLAGENIIYDTGSRSIIEYNTFSHTANGIGIWHNAEEMQNVIVRNNIFHDMARYDVDTWMQPLVSGGSASGPAQIYMSVPGGGHLIYNNIFYNNCQPFSNVNQTSCFAIATSAQANSTTTAGIYNNTIYNMFHPNSYATGTDPGPSAVLTVRNNIGYLVPGGHIFQGTTISNNLTTNPSFVNAAGTDFHLLSGSAAINAGVNLSTIFTTDYDGVIRPASGAWEIGAYEFGADTTPPAAPTGVRVQ